MFSWILDIWDKLTRDHVLNREDPYPNFVVHPYNLEKRDGLIFLYKEQEHFYEGKSYL